MHNIGATSLHKKECVSLQVKQEIEHQSEGHPICTRYIQLK